MASAIGRLRAKSLNRLIGGPMGGSAASASAMRGASETEAVMPLWYDFENRSATRQQAGAGFEHRAAGYGRPRRPRPTLDAADHVGAARRPPGLPGAAVPLRRHVVVGAAHPPRRDDRRRPGRADRRRLRPDPH